jgi:hypothetical protein
MFNRNSEYQIELQSQNMHTLVFALLEINRLQSPLSDLR